MPNTDPAVFTKRDPIDCCCVLGGSHPNTCGVRGLVTMKVERLSGPGCIGVISYVTSEWSTPNPASGGYFVRNRTHNYNIVTCLEEPVIQRDSTPPTTCCNLGVWVDNNWPVRPFGVDFGLDHPPGPNWQNFDLLSISGEFHGDCSTLVDKWVATFQNNGLLRQTFTLTLYRDDAPNFCAEDDECARSCCLPDMTCREDLTDIQCLGLGGIPGELGSRCYNAGCDEATPYNGACCDPVTGNCVMSTEAGCPPPRVFRGLGTSCASANCPPPVAACCKDGNCTMTTQVGCQTIGGTWHAGTNCNDPATCASPGACCLAGGCQDVGSAAACAALGGVFQGPGTLCVGSQCIGACCVPLVHGYTCTQETQSVCVNDLLGTWFPNTPCFPSPCPGGTGGRGSGGFR